MTSVRLGQFELDQPIGRGGMGEVWLGTFLGDGRRVAVKVITSQKVHSREYLDGFRREVRAVAGLDHPGIVRVYDYGPIPDETAASSGGRLVADSPYFVMEYARGGSLKRAAWPSDWLPLRQMLLDILDALAHAHARGIIHRDLKPENILIDGRDGERDRLKLTDFGIAHAIEPDREDALRKSLGSSTAGTPYYMPPEQSRSDWRDYGPWTDLYALGCVAYELTTGAPPFDADHPIKIAIQHMSESPRPLQPRLSVPKGLQNWIFRLLEKQPEARFQCAADAARALLALPAPEPSVPTSDDGESERTEHTETKVGGHAFLLDDDDVASQTTLFGLEPPTAILDPPQLGDEDSHSTKPLSSAAIEFERERSRPDMLPPRHTDAPSIPSDWRRKKTASADVLGGVGLGLFGLRTIPFVDRDAARDLIWQTLRDVQRDHQMQIVAVTGAPGLGKSRLVEWMIERASELGAARPIKASHGPITGPSHGLGRMVANAFSCVGMPRDEARDRIGYRLEVETGAKDDEYIELGVAPALSELAVSSYRDEDDAPEDSRGHGLTSREERFEPIRHMLDIFGRERPVIMWLDDIQWGRESIEFVRYLQEDERRSALPLLVLMTLQPDELERADDIARGIDDCMASGACHLIELGALTDQDHLELVNGLLTLEPSLAETVRDVTSGNPLFATQLVGDWVERGTLELGADGFQLAADAAESLPSDVYALWQRRIEHVLDSIDAADALPALELAAASDREVAEGEWRRACELAELSFPIDAVDALLGQGLMTQTETGWAFTHGMMVDALVRSAQNQARSKRWHVVWAELLAPRATKEDPQSSYRRAIHLIEAESDADALDAIFVAFKAMMRAGEFVATAQLIDERKRLTERLGLPEVDAERGKTAALESELARMVGDYDRAERLALEVVEAAEQYGDAWQEPRLEAEVDLASIYIQQGRHDEVISLLERLSTEFEALGRASHQADVLQRLGWTLVRLGEHDRAEEVLEQAHALYESSSYLRGQGWCLFSLGGSCKQRGELDRAEELLSDATEIFEETGDRQGLAEGINGLAEVQRQRGHLDEAEANYRRAFAIWKSLGAASAAVARLNLALVALDRGNIELARERFDESARHFRSKNRPGFELFAQIGLLACHAAVDNAARARHTLERIEALLDDVTYVDTDLANPARIAGEHFFEAGRDGLALRALTISRRQYSQLGHDDQVEDIDRMIEVIESRGTSR